MWRILIELTHGLSLFVNVCRVFDNSVSFYKLLNQIKIDFSFNLTADEGKVHCLSYPLTSHDFSKSDILNFNHTSILVILPNDV